MILLISPTSYAEAQLVIDAGADIIDMKNVHEGSLGAQYPWETKSVVELAKRFDTKISATLGDLPFKPGTAGLAALGAAQVGATYIKAGLHGMSTYDEARQMMDVIRRSIRLVSETADVVAAGYADYRRFGGVAPLDVVRAAKATDCDVVMIDTAIKDGQTLFDNMSLDELHQFIAAGRAAGMKVGLAGSIKFEHVDLLRQLKPDIVGVRGAVCEGDDRTSRISPERTRQFVRLVQQEAPSPSAP